jgi:hypothetical protein
MPTRVKKPSSWGFALDEQYLRRIFQSCAEHAAKTESSKVDIGVYATLDDGSIVESDGLGEILSLDNSGSR